MKNLIMLIAVTFSFAIANAQSTVKKSQNAQTISAKKSECKPGCEKTCCSKAKTKSCSKSKSSKSCSKSCTGSQAAYNKLVSPSNFVQYMDRFPAEQVVDVRTPAELKGNGSIKGALNIDYNASNFKEEMLKLDKNKAIMVYCRSGNRSAKTVHLLKDWGFTKIYDMEGGYNAYLKAFPKK